VSFDYEACPSPDSDVFADGESRPDGDEQDCDPFDGGSLSAWADFQSFWPLSAGSTMGSPFELFNSLSLGRGAPAALDGNVSYWNIADGCPPQTQRLDEWSLTC
jgi:hypothetical protein